MLQQFSSGSLVIHEPLKGRVALVTGGGRGFGRAIALALSAAGAAVIVVARSDDQIQATVAAMTALGGAGHGVCGDVSQHDVADRAVKEAEERFGAVTILVHAAGVAGPFGPVWTVDPQEWWSAQSIHVGGAVSPARKIAAIPRYPTPLTAVS